MITIDGSMGEGGGQIFRSSLSLAMCTGKSVTIDNIRSGRKKPGLLRQHLACLRASEEISGAKVEGASLGSTRVEFHPGAINAGKYKYTIGSAGSTMLVFQTILPALLRANTESELVFEGGTHNMAAPSFDFIAKSFVPVLKQMHMDIEVSLERFGFYPNGGGRWRASIAPARETTPITLRERGELVARKAIAKSSRIPTHVTERELSYIKRKLQWADLELEQALVDSFGPGNIVSLQVQFEALTEVFDAVGALGLSAERVAGNSVKEFKRYMKSAAVVGEHLCDQLLLPMALGSGGVFRTLKPSLHTLTNIEVIRRFVDCEIKVEALGDDDYELAVVV